MLPAEIGAQAGEVVLDLHGLDVIAGDQANVVDGDDVVGVDHAQHQHVVPLHQGDAFVALSQVLGDQSQQILIHLPGSDLQSRPGLWQLPPQQQNGALVSLR